MSVDGEEIGSGRVERSECGGPGRLSRHLSVGVETDAFRHEAKYLWLGLHVGLVVHGEWRHPSPGEEQLPVCLSTHDSFDVSLDVLGMP
jgi:hypothetical protein